MDAGFVKVTVTPNVQAVPVALAAQSASLLACSAGELQRAIRELTLTNPMVEPVEGDDPYYDLIASIPARRETLAEHLSAQLRMTLREPALLRVCLLLANSLDANGCFTGHCGISRRWSLPVWAHATCRNVCGCSYRLWAIPIPWRH